MPGGIGAEQCLVAHRGSQAHGHACGPLLRVLAGLVWAVALGEEHLERRQRGHHRPVDLGVVDDDGLLGNARHAQHLRWGLDRRNRSIEHGGIKHCRRVRRGARRASCASCHRKRSFFLLFTGVYAPWVCSRTEEMTALVASICVSG